MSLVFRVEWVEINAEYNSDFQITVLDANSGEYIPLPPEVYDGLYVIEEGYDGDALRFIDDAVREIAGQYAVDGAIYVKAVSDSITIV